VVPRLRWRRLGLAWVVSEPPGIAGLAAGAFFSGEGAGAGVLPVCAKAGCKENVSAINEMQARIFVTATSVMLDVGRRNRDLSCKYAMPIRFIPMVRSPTIDRTIACDRMRHASVFQFLCRGMFVRCGPYLCSSASSHLSLIFPGHVITCLNRIARASLRTKGDGHSELQIGELTLAIHRISRGIGRKHTNWEYCRRVTLLQIIASAFVIFSGVVSSTLGQPKGLPSVGTPEVKPATPDPLVAATSRWDANHDGVFTCEEWRQYADRLFTIADKNSDGVLDDKEFQKIGNIEPIFAGADMAYFDDNNDNRISRSEFADKPSPLFARYDANRDCRVTAEEIKVSPRPTSGKGTAPRGRSGSGGGGGRSGF
jgi:hypothetical protein